MGLLTLGSIIFLGICAALLSASETAITATSRVRLYRHAMEGNKKAALVLELQKKMGHVISSILLANTWIITFMTALATGLFTRWMGPQGVVYATCLMGVFLTLYIEIMPKVFVYQHPETMAMRFARGLNTLCKILTPVTLLMDGIAKRTLEILGLSLSQSLRSNQSREDLQGAIELYKGGYTALKSRQMLRSVLNLESMNLTAVMIPMAEIYALSMDEPIHLLVQKVLNQNFTRIPIWENNPSHIIGILNVRHLMAKLHKGNALNTQDVRALLTPAICVPEETSLLAQLEGFRFGQSRLVFVKDHENSVKGLVTLEDILEEIVGEIWEEHEQPHIIFKHTTLATLNAAHNLNLPEHHGTLEQFLTHSLGHAPKEGDALYLKNVRFHVIHYQDQVMKIAMTLVKTLP